MPAPHQKNKLHKQDQKNLIIFAIAFGIVYILFDMFVLRPHMERVDAYHKQVTQKKAEIETGFRPPEFRPRKDILAENPRAHIEHDSLIGTINLKGGRFDDIRLKKYFETLEKKENVAVMSPEHSRFPRYAEFGWLDSSGRNDLLPNDESIWRVKSSNDDKTTIYWQNGRGLTFERDIEFTDNYLLKITQRIVNSGSSSYVFYPYALITEHGLPSQLAHRWIIHEGPIGFINDLLEERNYSDMPANRLEEIESKTGWIGFTEQYWLTAILPEQETEKTYRYAYTPPKDEGKVKSQYQVDVLSGAEQVPPNGSVEHVTYVFAGAKELNTLKQYGRDLNVKSFDAAIDFGWFWFLTKPFFTVLLMINSVTGYFAVTMLTFALILRLLIFPMANTSYRSFAKLRIIAPRIMELKEMYSDDKPALQRAMVELYQKEKVNPAAGCLPILIQIPIFFSLFKVLNVAIEMRHAPGFFWIEDLSAPDPTSLFNLFGLLPFDVPQFLMIGAWPCIMVITMLFQRSMNPPPTDPVVRDMFRFMPYFMGFIMAGFAAGLVIYWTFSNLLSSIQQYTIMRMMGVEVKFFQGWFGREVQKNEPDIARLGLSEDLLKYHKDDKDKEEITGEDGEDTAEAEEPKQVSPPKPRRKKKK